METFWRLKLNSYLVGNRISFVYFYFHRDSFPDFLIRLAFKGYELSISHTYSIM
jgi:hypothetical protein